MRQPGVESIGLKQRTLDASAGYPERLLTIDDVGEWLGVPKGTLYQWRSRSLGPVAIKVGGALRYRREEVERWLDEQSDAPRQ